MKRMTMLAIGLLVFAAAFTVSTHATNAQGPTPGAPAAAPEAAAQTYLVIVGSEDTTRGADLEAFFPAIVHVHVGDTITWRLNSEEIHNVTFLAGAQPPDFIVPIPNAPQGAMMFNPQVVLPAAPKDGKYDGSSFVTSGIMGPGQGEAQEFSLTFTKTGTFQYGCIIHGEENMLGTVIVDDPGATIPSPADVSAQGMAEANALAAKVDGVVQAAQQSIKPDTKNADGTTTHYVVVGYAQGQIDMMAFFPSKLTVAPGDTVMWSFSDKDLAPHTVSFLNGATQPDLVMVAPQPNGPPMITFNPDVVMPKNVDKLLTREGIFNSGLIDPHAPGSHSFSLKMGSVAGDYEFICMLHDENGMKGTLTIAPK